MNTSLVRKKNGLIIENAVILPAYYKTVKRGGKIELTEM